MAFIYVTIVCFMVSISSCISTHHSPQVYEILGDFFPPESSRKPRQSTKENLKAFEVPVFEYSKAMQQDQQKWRYFRQQQADAQNHARIQQLMRNGAFVQYQPDLEEFVQKPDRPSVPHLGQNWRIVHPKFVKENGDGLHVFDAKRSRKRHANPAEIRRLNANIKAAEDNVKKAIEQTRRNRMKGADAEEAESVVDAKTENIDRQDHVYLQNQHAIVITPQNSEGRTIQQQLGGFHRAATPNEIDALHALLGKHPNVQLQGLKQLVATEPAIITTQPQPFQLQKDHTPIQEQQNDIENTQIRPNIHVPPQAQLPTAQGHAFISSPSSTLKQEQIFSELQGHLDAVTRAHVQNALAQAQRQVVADVQAQHHAIALEKAQAERTALQQIQRAQAEAETLAYLQAHKQGSKQDFPQAQALVQSHAQAQAQQAQAHAAEAAHAAAQAQQVQAQLQAQAEAEAQAHAEAQAQAHAQAQAQAEAQIQAEANAKSILLNQHQVPVQQLSPTGEANLQIALAHSHRQAQAYQQHSLKAQTPAEVKKYFHKKVHRGVIKAQGHEQGDLQYAAKYSFGYRIKDYEHRNDYGHEETRDGKMTKGHYHVLLPDGRRQNVQYYADPSGYHAKVTYEIVEH